MDNLDEEFQGNQEIGFSPKLKSSLKSIRMWVGLSGVLLAVSACAGFVLALFALYDTLSNPTSYSFEENLFGSILLTITSMLLFIIGFNLKRFGNSVKKGLLNHNQVQIEQGFSRLNLVTIILSVLVILGFLFLLFVLGVIVFYALLYGF